MTEERKKNMLDHGTAIHEGVINAFYRCKEICQEESKKLREAGHINDKNEWLFQARIVNLFVSTTYGMVYKAVAETNLKAQQAESSNQAKGQE